jgi:hypothetical protein
MSNIPTPDIKNILIIILVIAVVLEIIRKVLKRKGIKMPVTVRTWKSYLTGQGAILLGFLALGGSVAWASAYYGPLQGKVSKGGQLIEYRQLNPSEHIVYEDQNVEGYSHITVLTRTTAPQNGSATVTIYGDQNEGSKGEFMRIESVSTSWSRWDQENSNKHISLIIEPSPQKGAVSATQVDVLIYLTPK